MGRVSLPDKDEVDLAIRAHHKFLLERGVEIGQENSAFDVVPPTDDEIALVVLRSLRRLLWTRAAHESEELWGYCKAQREAVKAVELLVQKANALAEDAARHAQAQHATVSAPFASLEQQVTEAEQQFKERIPTNEILFAASDWKKHRDTVQLLLEKLGVDPRTIEGLFDAHSERNKANRISQRNRRLGIPRKDRPRREKE